MTQDQAEKFEYNYNFEDDEKISERRKESLRKNYENMTLQDIDHLFLSAHKYDKKTNKPLYKKPKSIHELVYLSMLRNYDLLERIKSLEEYVNELSNTVMRLKDNAERA